MARPPETGQSDDATDDERPPVWTWDTPARSQTRVLPTRSGRAGSGLPTPRCITWSSSAAGRPVLSLRPSWATASGGQTRPKHPGRTRPHPHLEAPFARSGGRHDGCRSRCGQLFGAGCDHYFRRIGEMIGLDRTRREVHLAGAMTPKARRLRRPAPSSTIPWRSRSDSGNDFGTPGAQDFAISLDTAEQAVRFHQRLVNRFIRAHAQPGPVQPGQLHVTIIRDGATGTDQQRTAPHHPPARGLRPRPDRPRKGPQVHAGRSRRAHPSGGAGMIAEGGRGFCASLAWTCARKRGSSKSVRTASDWRMATSSAPNLWSGRPG